jgi:hypothetical protein
MQFEAGMSVLWEVVKQHPTLTADLFVHQPKGLKYQTFRKLYDINYSDVGTNRRLTEENTMYSWEIFLKDCAGTVILDWNRATSRSCYCPLTTLAQNDIEGWGYSILLGKLVYLVWFHQWLLHFATDFTVFHCPCFKYDKQIILHDLKVQQTLQHTSRQIIFSYKL